MFSLFLVIFYILSPLGKKYGYFLPIGERKNMHFPPFLSPSNNFFPQNCYLAIFFWGGQTEKYTHLYIF